MTSAAFVVTEDTCVFKVIETLLLVGWGRGSAAKSRWCDFSIYLQAWTENEEDGGSGGDKVGGGLVGLSKDSAASRRKCRGFNDNDDERLIAGGDVGVVCLLSLFVDCRLFLPFVVVGMASTVVGKC